MDERNPARVRATAGRLRSAIDGRIRPGRTGPLSLPPTDVCSRARIERDDRFDGRFYFAVRTTGVFCRPVCPSRTALERNVEYFVSAPAALAAGYRPCLRCRPEFGPNALEGSDDLGRVLAEIENGALDDEGSVAELAASVGLGERRLRRLFERELGTSPVRVAQTRRLLLARQLLETSDTSIIDIAFASGFASLRRFNEAFRDGFGVTPSEFRSQAPTDTSGGDAATGPSATEHSGTLVLRLGVRTPYDAAFLMKYLQARAIGGVERVVETDEFVYERTFDEGDAAGLLRVVFESSPESTARSQLDRRAGAGATLRVGLTFTRRSDRLPNLVDLVGRVRHLFAIQDDPAAIEGLAHDPVLGPVATRFPGTRFPGCFDPFEVGVRVILGQQVTVAGASTLAGRLARTWGRPLDRNAPETSGEDGSDLPHLVFPPALKLVDADLESIGLPRTRAQSIREFAGLLAGEPDLFERAEDPRRVRRALLELPGLGDWTATLIAMRALRWRDGFPAGDLVLRKNYALVSGSTLPSERQLRELADAWRPERALAAVLLWRAS